MPDMRGLLSSVKDALQGKLLDAVLGALLDQVVEQRKQELVILRRIEGKVDALLQGPFNAGSDWLASASRPHRSHADRIAYIERALERFMDAQAQLSGYPKVVSQLHVALAHGLLGHPEDFEEWLVRAYETADGALMGSLRKAERGHGFFTGMFGGSRRAARAFFREFRAYTLVLEDLDTVLGGHPSIQWSAEVQEWEEWVPPVEQGDPRNGMTTMRALVVHRDGRLLAKLSVP